MRSRSKLFRLDIVCKNQSPRCGCGFSAGAGAGAVLVRVKILRCGFAGAGAGAVKFFGAGNNINDL